MTSGAYDRHLARLRRLSAARLETLVDALAAHMPDGVRWTEPTGGQQLWVELPDAIDTADLFADAMGRGVLFAPGYQFHCDGRPSSALRLTVAMADEAALRRGVEILGGLVRDRLSAPASAVGAAGVHV